MNTYNFHVTLYDLAFLGTIFIGLTFAALLQFTKSINQAPNRFLALALTVMVLWVARILAIDIGLDAYFPFWSRLPMQFSLALGPLLYFYVLKTTRPDYKFRRRDLLNFFPLLLEFGVFVLEVSENIKTGVQTYDTPTFHQLNPILLSLAFISVAIYLCLCYKLIENFYRQQKFTGGDRRRHELRWLRNLLAGFALLWLLWIPFTAAGYFYNFGAPAYYPLYLLLASMMIWMGAKAFINPEIDVTVSSVPILKPLLPAELKQKGFWLKKVVKENRYYQDPELTLSSLAEKLDLGTHELSRIINTVLKKNFNDFINEYRVQETTRKMQDPDFDHITLLGIAYESGFSSQSSFNRIFRQMTGKSPVEYKNDLKKEQPSYNLGSKPQVVPVILHRESPPKWYHEKANRSYMFKNYLKIARRNLARNKSYAAINITGLAVGIAVCMVIFIIIQFQTSFDGFHAKKDRIYRVLTEYHHAGSADISYGRDLPFPIPLGLKTAFPQLEVAPIFASQNDQLLILDNNGIVVKKFKEQRGLFFTAPSFFEIFDFPLLAGSYASLKNPGNVLLTQEIAEKYFGDWKTAMGKTIKLQVGGYMFEHGTDLVTVSGILATIPANSDFQLKAVVAYGTSFTGSYLASSTDWNETVSDFGCYILLPPNTSVSNFNQQLRSYSQKVESPANKDSHIAQPLSAVHFDAGVGDYSNKTISHQLLNVLWLIAAFILLIACVNFVNLSTAQAVNRAKEVGVRKVLGSNKFQLQVQFIVETFLIVISAVILAAVITIIALPYVNQLLELSVSFDLFTNPAIALFLVTVTIAVTALAGFYPSMVLSGFNPINALKNKLTASTANGISLRRGLVVFQFIIAQALIIGTLIIVKQMNYFMDQPLGFDKEAVINVPFRIDTTLSGKLGYLKTQLLSVPGIKTVSLSANTPVENGNDTWSALKFDHAAKESDFKVITKFADEEYVPAYKLPLIAGRNLLPSVMTREFLVNESLVRSLGLKKPEDILGKEISIWNGQIQCPVVGVLKDFNDRSFRNEVAPLVITTDAAMYNQLAIKLETKKMSSTLPAIEKIFDQTYPDFVYEYRFLDEKIAGFYKQENQLAALYQIFAVIAIFLSCLGLYGLASFMAVQRVKEVGIRKVLGANTGSIVYLFSKEFIILIVIAFAIATPVSWYYMHRWLQDYAYRINISWWLFAMGGLAAIVIALATVSFQAIKAAIADPVKSLRNE